MAKAKKFWFYKRQVNETLLQVLGLCVPPKLQIFVEMFCRNLESVTWRTSVVHQNGGRKIVQTSGRYFGCLGDWLLVLKKQAFKWTFSSNFWKGSKSWDKYLFFNKLDRSLQNAKFKMFWFPKEARYWAVKL